MVIKEPDDNGEWSKHVKQRLKTHDIKLVLMVSMGTVLEDSDIYVICK
jgi:hypothetical protein